MKRKAILTFWIYLFAVGCSSQPKVPWNPKLSFYYWKTTYGGDLQMNGYSLDSMKSIGVDRLYIRFFDVTWDPKINQPMPTNILAIRTPGYLPDEIVPTVFITQEAIQKVSRAEIKYFATNILTQVKRLLGRLDKRVVPEIQLDCDWTPTTRENYFDLLEEIGKQKALLDPAVSISATIRLHQVKYRDRTGVPPVARGALLVYQTDSPLKLDARSDILDVREAESYLSKVGAYPLPLDIALPAFSWTAQYSHDGRFIRLIYESDTYGFQEALKSKQIVKKGGSIYEVAEDTYLGGLSVMKGDMLKVDESNIADDLKILEYLKGRLATRNPHLIFFHYDSLWRFLNGGDEKLKPFLTP